MITINVSKQRINNQLLQNGNNHLLFSVLFQAQERRKMPPIV